MKVDRVKKNNGLRFKTYFLMFFLLTSLPLKTMAPVSIGLKAKIIGMLWSIKDIAGSAAVMHATVLSIDALRLKIKSMLKKDQEEGEAFELQEMQERQEQILQTILSRLDEIKTTQAMELERKDQFFDNSIELIQSIPNLQPTTLVFIQSLNHNVALLKQLSKHPEFAQLLLPYLDAIAELALQASENGTPPEFFRMMGGLFLYALEVNDHDQRLSQDVIKLSGKMLAFTQCDKFEQCNDTVLFENLDPFLAAYLLQGPIKKNGASSPTTNNVRGRVAYLKMQQNSQIQKSDKSEVDE